MLPPEELELLEELLDEELLEELELDEDELLEELELDDELLDELDEEELLEELELLDDAEFPVPPQAHTRSVANTGALHRESFVDVSNIILITVGYY